jgi:hypothetical protein
MAKDLKLVTVFMDWDAFPILFGEVEWYEPLTRKDLTKVTVYRVRFPQGAEFYEEIDLKTERIVGYAKGWGGDTDQG